MRDGAESLKLVVYESRGQLFAPRPPSRGSRSGSTGVLAPRPALENSSFSYSQHPERPLNKN